MYDTYDPTYRLPHNAYTWPVFTRDVVTTKLETTAYSPAGPGKRHVVARKLYTAKGLVTSFHFHVSIWFRIAPIHAVKPPQTLLPHSTILKPGTDPHGASKGRREFDPHGDFAFHIEIEGLGTMAFQKFDGIDVEIDQIEYKDSLDHHPHKRPGIHRYGNIKLTKGVITNTKLWNWIESVMKGDVQRKNGSIHVLSDAHDKGKPEITYNFYQAWPCKWSGLRLDGKGSGGLVEELELAVDYIGRGK